VPWLSAPRKERPAAPLRGYKLAHPMVSADGTQGGFSGVTIGRATVYQAVATAICAQGARHRSPSRWCDCGFYCVHNMADAEALSYDPDYRYAVLLEVAASGRFMRYERGLRYAQQRVTAVWTYRCDCGGPATGFVETGAGVSGWRRLAGRCAGCAGRRPRLSLAGFARLLGGPPVRPYDAGLHGQPGGRVAGPLLAEQPAGETAVRAAGAPPDALPGTVPDAVPAGPELDAVDREALVPVLAAEVALLQARLDEVQRQLARLTGQS
jgi:hypothetical protein